MMTRDVVSVSIVLFVFLLPLVLCGTIGRGENVDLNGLEEHIAAKLMARRMKAETENDAPLLQDAPERNVQSAKNWAEEYAAVKKELEKEGKWCCIW